MSEYCDGNGIARPTNSNRISVVHLGHSDLLAGVLVVKDIETWREVRALLTSGVVRRGLGMPMDAVEQRLRLSLPPLVVRRSHPFGERHGGCLWLCGDLMGHEVISTHYADYC